MSLNKPTSTRRQFISSATAGTVAALAAPAVHSLAKTDSKLIIGEGDHRYEVQHMWGELPDKFNWQTTHNVAVDKNQNVYVIHEGRHDQKDHPSIFVFDHDGKFIRAFGSQFQGGGHGLEVREEDGEEFLYVSGYQAIKSFAKLTLNGDVLWWKNAPMESGVYAENEDRKKEGKWGRDRFMPTNFAFLPDGDFLLADGYGSYFIHRYDRDGNWKNSFGGPGDGQGTFNTPHGIWFDERPGREPAVVIADRAHHTIQYMSVDGKHQQTVDGFGLPANFDTYEDLLLVPELLARVTLLGKDNKVVAHLGDDVARIKADSKFAIRRDETAWNTGKFVHPHDACFDKEGNIFVAEWVGTGRVTKLTRVS